GQDERALLFAAAACCDAGDGIGDPTELALLGAAKARFGIERSAIDAERPRVAEAPFDSVRKRMSIRRADGVLYVKGAVESVLPLCESGQSGALEANLQMARRGLRVLAVGVGKSEREEGLTLLGLVGIADPPRTEA